MFQDSHFNYSVFSLPSSESINLKTYTHFNQLKSNDDVKRTHLFNGRYENIYIEKQKIPELTQILDFANQCAKQVLELNKDLDIGFWFNDMPPQSVTIAHSHDDDDELLSAAYYIKVPENSGDLVLYNKQQKKIITPSEGQLILFNANCLHEVTKNNSEHHRLSIGINFGIRQD